MSQAHLLVLAGSNVAVSRWPGCQQHSATGLQTGMHSEPPPVLSLGMQPTPGFTCAIPHALVLLLPLPPAAVLRLCPAVVRFFGGRQAATNFVLSAYEPELAAMEREVRGAAWCSGRWVGPAAGFSHCCSAPRAAHNHTVAQQCCLQGVSTGLSPSLGKLAFIVCMPQTRLGTWYSGCHVGVRKFHTPAHPEVQSAFAQPASRTDLPQGSSLVYVSCRVMLPRGWDTCLTCAPGGLCSRAARARTPHPACRSTATPAPPVRPRQTATAAGSPQSCAQTTQQQARRRRGRGALLQQQARQHRAWGMRTALTAGLVASVGARPPPSCWNWCRRPTWTASSSCQVCV